MMTGRSTGLIVLLCLAALPACATVAAEPEPLLFATFAEEETQLENVCLLVESLRTFGGLRKDAPFRLYLPDELAAADGGALGRLRGLGVDVRTVEAPADALWYPFARKVFAAARAEADAAGDASPILAWLDDDTLFLDDPAELSLLAGEAFGYRPVMHRNIGSLWSERPDAFWKRAYDKMGVAATALFPMTTPADGEEIRPYFNAGCLIIRPERWILRAWSEQFSILYRDPILLDLCRKDPLKRIFIHQAALTGAVLNGLSRDEMRELSDRVNYPLFFKEMFGAKREFKDIDGVVTIRHESFFRNRPADWADVIDGPADRIDWMRTHLEGRRQR